MSDSYNKHIAQLYHDLVLPTSTTYPPLGFDTRLFLLTHSVQLQPLSSHYCRQSLTKLSFHYAKQPLVSSPPQDSLFDVLGRYSDKQLENVMISMACGPVNPHSFFDPLLWTSIQDGILWDDEDELLPISPSLLHLSGYGPQFEDFLLDHDLGSHMYRQHHSEPLPGLPTTISPSSDTPPLPTPVSLGPDFDNLVRHHCLTPNFHMHLTRYDPDVVFHPTLLNNYHSAHVTNDQDYIVIILDTGASYGLTSDPSDFVEITYGNFGSMTTAASDTKYPLIATGIVEYEALSEDGTLYKLRYPANLCTAAGTRLCPPQIVSKYNQLDQREAQYFGNHQFFSMYVNSHNKDKVTIPIDSRINLPLLKAKKVPVSHQSNRSTTCTCTDTYWCRCCIDTSQTISASARFDQLYKVSLSEESNRNLSGPQRHILLDHERLGHVHMDLLRRLYSPHRSTCDTNTKNESCVCTPCLTPNFKSLVSCELPQCCACNLAKARKQPTGSTTTTESPHGHHLNDSPHLQPGDLVSMDHYESAVRGRLWETFGKERPEHRYCGGTLFYDHASGLIFVQHQVSLGASDTIRSKNTFELFAERCGRKITRYHTDNGHFTAEAFEASLRREGPTPQIHTLSGAGAHHQNGGAERAIQTVSYMARAMMVHAYLHWPSHFSPTLWPMALDYACWVYNHVPKKDSQTAPMETFTGTTMDCRYLRRARVWGCPAYVLNPRLADGQKIPKWALRARQGQFLGFSTQHSSTVGMILNFQTGHISPQFHVVYDEKFTTVASNHDTSTLDLSGWIDRLTHDVYLDDYNADTDGDLPGLAPEWALPRLPTESIEGEEHPPDGLVDGTQRQQGELRQQGENAPHIQGQGEAAPQAAPSPLTQRDAQAPPVAVQQPPLTPQGEPPPPVPVLQSPPQGEVPQQGEPRQQGEPAQQGESTLRRSQRNPQPIRRFPDPERRFAPDHHETEWETSLLSTYHAPSKLNSDPTVTKFAHVANSLEWEPTSVTDFDSYSGYFDHLYSQQANSNAVVVDDWHPLAFSAKTVDSDTPSYFDLPRMDFVEQERWREAMNTELLELESHGTFTIVPRSKAAGKEIVDTMWALRRKRLPDGTISRWKARLVVRGDQQKSITGRDSTYAPVVEWSTVRLLLVLGLQHDLVTTSIDFKNAFVQSSLPEPIYVEFPHGYSAGKDKILEVTKSLYGDKRAPQLWYKHIKSHLESAELGFKVAESDHCLFLRKDCILVLYVDDCILVAKDQQTIDNILETLKRRGLNFDKMADLAAYLGVQLTHNPDKSIELKQPFLAESIIEAMGLSDGGHKPTPATKVIGKSLSEGRFRESFNYRSVVGMLLYLGGNSRLDCSFGIHQCARFSADPRQPHGEALKRIGRYLVGTKDKGLIMRPNGKLNLDCYVDSDFAGLWGTEHADDPACARSRMGFMLTLGGVPVTWTSKLTTEICLSTMEAEYVALSTAMRALLPMRRKLEEICTHFELPMEGLSTITSSVFEDNQAALQLATTDPPRLTPRSKSLAVKYHWFRAKLVRGVIEVKPISSGEQLADILTKPLTPDKFVIARKLCMGW